METSKELQRLTGEVKLTLRGLAKLLGECMIPISGDKLILKLNRALTEETYNNSQDKSDAHKRKLQTGAKVYSGMFMGLKYWTYFRLAYRLSKPFIE